MARDMRDDGTGPRSAEEGVAGVGAEGGQQLLPRWRRSDGVESEDAVGMAASWEATRASTLLERKFDRMEEAAEKR